MGQNLGPCLRMTVGRTTIREPEWVSRSWAPAGSGRTSTVRSVSAPWVAAVSQVICGRDDSAQPEEPPIVGMPAPLQLRFEIECRARPCLHVHGTRDRKPTPELPGPGAEQRGRGRVHVTLDSEPTERGTGISSGPVVLHAVPRPRAPAPFISLHVSDLLALAPPRGHCLVLPVGTGAPVIPLQGLGHTAPQLLHVLIDRAAGGPRAGGRPDRTEPPAHPERATSSAPVPRARAPRSIPDGSPTFRKAIDRASPVLATVRSVIGTRLEGEREGQPGGDGHLLGAPLDHRKGTPHSIGSSGIRGALKSVRSVCRRRDTIPPGPSAPPVRPGVTRGVEELHRIIGQGVGVKHETPES